MRKTRKNLAIVPTEMIQTKIYLIRGRKVMLDRDLAMLYGVGTGRLNEAVKRNIERFPEDFMFKLNKQEVKIWESYILGIDLRSQIATSSLRSQFAILKQGQHIKYAPYVFTEQGVAMLSSVLNSKRAVQVNIQIMRTFTKMREMLASHKELREKIEAMEKKYDKKFRVVFEAIHALLKEEKGPKRKVGF